MSILAWFAGPIMATPTEHGETVQEAAGDVTEDRLKNAD
jgi:hypothetical protein